MYIRLPRSPVTQNFERIASFGDNQPPELCLLRKTTRCILIRITAHKKKQLQVYAETLDYMLSDRQLARYRVITNDVSLVAEYAFEYMPTKAIKSLVSERLKATDSNTVEPVLVIGSYYKDIADSIMDNTEDKFIYYLALAKDGQTSDVAAHPSIPVINIDDNGCKLGYDDNTKVPMAIYFGEDDEAKEFYTNVSKKREEFIKSKT